MWAGWGVQGRGSLSNYSETYPTMESAKHVSNVFNIDIDLAARSYPTALYEVPAAPSPPLATTRITACYTSLSTAISSILQAIPCPKM